MKTILLSTFFLVLSWSTSAQLAVANDQTPEQLILSTFLGENLTVSNIKFNGSVANAQTISDQVARFSNGNAGLSCEQGLILCTGKAIMALGPNNNGSATNTTATPFTGDPDLAMVSGGSVSNICNIEFDFIPNGDTVLFEYIFASEEYPAYVNSTFNDIFGLFLSGPGISGPYNNGAINIAIIPATSQAVSINNLNNGNNNLGPCENCAYYVDNGIGATPEINTEIQFNGRSAILTASGVVSPGATYHLKFVIGNLMDNLYDSAMFLTRGSFRSATLGTQNFLADTATIYPNPAADFIQINHADAISNVAIFDLQGRTLVNIKTQGSAININTSGLRAGTYIVELISTHHQSSRQKLIIK